MKPKNEPLNHHPAKTSQTKVRKEKGSQTDQHDEDRVHEEAPRSSYNPTPLDLDIFLPWVCIEWECSRYVTVKRIIQEPYVSKRDRNISTRKLAKLKHHEDKNHTSDIVDEVEVKSAGSKSEVGESVQITTIYDIKGTLIEIAFHKQFNVPQKVIHVLNFCFPYHTFLTKLSFCDGELTSILLQEIAKMLPHSNITELILNGNYVPEGNYYILFDHTSQLKHLSLSRCSLNDLACSELMATLKCGGSVLMVLDLSMNDLTDDSARAIGHFLRLNRTLLHLNLSGNYITTIGADAILNSLSEFPLTVQEIMDMRRRKLVYVENKIAIYTRCLEDTMRKRQSIKKVPPVGKASKNVQYMKRENPLLDIAERMAAEITGEFCDPLNRNGTVSKNEHLYCRGNFTLCSLNMSFNNLDYFSVRHIYSVLEYQNKYAKPGDTGLLRVVIDGNPVPVEVPEYLMIDEYLKLAIGKMSPPIQTKNQKTTIK